jgi:hypothetical protein
VSRVVAVIIVFLVQPLIGLPLGMRVPGSFPHHRNKGRMARVNGARMAAAVAALAVVTGCGAAPASHHSTAKTAAHVSCYSRLHAWAHDRGLATMHQLAADEKAVSKGTTAIVAALSGTGRLAAALSQFQADATAVQTDAEAGAADPPPACANAASYSVAMRKYETSARDYQEAVPLMRAGQYDAAGTLLRAGTRATVQGNAELKAANATVSSLGG